MRRMLILGGDGFIGGTYARRQIGNGSLKIVSRKPAFGLENETICDDPFSLDENLFKDIDIVLNFLGLAHVSDLKNKELFQRVNCDLALDLARKAKKSGVTKFIQMSSVSVYGIMENINVMSVEQPITHYGESKLMADRALLKMQNSGFHVLIIRPPMIYGVGAPGNMRKLVNFVRKLPILPFNNANEKRAFLCIDNFCVLLDHAIEKELEGICLFHDIRSFSTHELVVLIGEALDLHKPIVSIPLKPLIKTLLPSYYRKLFGALQIESSFSIGGLVGLVDPAQVLQQMAKSMC